MVGHSHGTSHRRRTGHPSKLFSYQSNIVSRQSITVPTELPKGPGSQISALCPQHSISQRQAPYLVEAWAFHSRRRRSIGRRRWPSPVGPVHLHRVPGGRGTSGPATAPATGRRHVLGEVTGCSRLCLERWRCRDPLREWPHSCGQGRRQRRDGDEAIVNRWGLPEGTRDKATKLKSFPLPFFFFLKGSSSIFRFVKKVVKNSPL